MPGTSQVDGWRGGRRTRLTTVASTLVWLFVAASCSSLTGSEDAADPSASSAESELSSEATDDPDDSDPAGPAADSEPEPAFPDIWTKPVVTEILPKGNLGEAQVVLGPEGQRGWTLLGFVADYEADRSIATAWEAETPEGPWTAVELPSSENDSSVNDAVRTATLDIAVGSSGSTFGDATPMIWTRTGSADWVEIDLTSADSAGSEDPANEQQAQRLTKVSVTPDGATFAALGQRIEPNGKTVPVVWLSTDGQSWDPTDDIVVASDGTERVFDLAVGEAGYALVGERTGTQGNAQPMAWISATGRQWQAVALPMLDEAASHAVNSVVWFDGRYVAAGSEVQSDKREPRAWTSTDGETWEGPVVQFPQQGDGISTGGIGVARVVAGDQHVYAYADNQYQQQVWRTADGVSWENLGDVQSSGVTEIFLSDLAVEEDTLVAIGFRPSVFVFDQSWKSLAVPAIPQPTARPYVSALTADATGFVAVGAVVPRSAAGGTVDGARAWESIDGTTWESRQVDGANRGPLTDAVSTANGLMASGYVDVDYQIRQHGYAGLFFTTTEDGDLALGPHFPTNPDEARVVFNNIATTVDGVVTGGWQYNRATDTTEAYVAEMAFDGEPRKAAIDFESRGDSFAMVCADGAGTAVAISFSFLDRTSVFQAFRRDESGSWTEAVATDSSFDEGLWADPDSCAHGPDGFLMVGVRTDLVDEDLGLWASADGSEWAAIEPPADLQESANQWADDVVGTDDGYLVVGNSFTDTDVLPYLWYLADGQWISTVITDNSSGEPQPANLRDLKVVERDGTIVVTGSDDGAYYMFTTTMDQVLESATAE